MQSVKGSYALIKEFDSVSMIKNKKRTLTYFHVQSLQPIQLRWM